MHSPPWNGANRRSALGAACRSHPQRGRSALDQNCRLSLCSLVLGSSSNSTRLYQELSNTLAFFVHSFILIPYLFWTQKRRPGGIYWVLLQCSNASYVGRKMDVWEIRCTIREKPMNTRGVMEASGVAGAWPWPWGLVLQCVCRTFRSWQCV